MKCTTVLHGGVYHQILTPHKSRNKRRKKIPCEVGLRRDDIQVQLYVRETVRHGTRTVLR